MNDLNGDLDRLIADAEKMHEKAAAQAELARVAYERAKEEMLRVERILKAAGVEMGEKPKSRPKPKSKPAQVNDQTRRVVLDAIHAYINSGQRVVARVPHSFTVTSLHSFAHGVHETSVRSAINNLRQEGIIRACGLVDGSPRRAPMAYVLGEGNEASE